VRQLCLRSPWFITRVVLQYHWMDEDLHGRQLLGFYETSAGKDTAVFIPRGHGKTLTSASRIIHKILNNPNTSIMYSSATEELASDFCAMVGQELMNNEYLQNAFPDILPQSKQQIESWGKKDGYSLPGRKPRVDPTLFALSLLGNPTGKHPDEVFIDDLIVMKNNNAAGYEKAERFIKECKMLLPAQSCLALTGTRWGDGDPYGKIIEGKIHGQQGPFATMVLSCYEDDNPKKPPIYPEKCRWTAKTPSGWTHAKLEARRAPEPEGGLGSYFDAQMRNDPAPEERQDIRVGDINKYYKDDMPSTKLGHVRAFGIEVLGGGAPIISLVNEQADELRFDIPVVEIGRRTSRGETKADRIRAAMEPVVRAGRCYAQPWMLGEAGDSAGFGYEVRRLGVAKHDDIVDTFSMIIELVGASFPDNNVKLLDVYIGADLAWTQERKSDHTVVMAVAVDAERNFWILDYDRFQISQASEIAARLIKFFRKWSPEEGTTPGQVKRNFALTYK